MKQTRVGREIYSLSPTELRRVRKCAKFAEVPWQAVAARPSTAIAFCEKVEKAMRAMKRDAAAPNIGSAQEQLVRKFLKGGTAGTAGSLYINLDTIYSYGPHFPIARRANGILIVTTKRSPSRTTSGHVNAVVRAAEDAGYRIRRGELAAASNPRRHARYLVQARRGASGLFRTLDSHRIKDRAIVKAVHYAKTQPSMQWRVLDNVRRPRKTIWHYKGGKVQVPAWRQKAPSGLVGFQHLLNPVKHNLDTKGERNRLEADVAMLKGRFKALVGQGRYDTAREVIGWFKGVADAAEASGSPAYYIKRMRSLARVLDSRIPEHPRRRGFEPPPSFLPNRAPQEVWGKATSAQRRHLLRAAGVAADSVGLFIGDSWNRLDAALRAMIQSKWEGTRRHRKASANPRGRRGRACTNPGHKHHPLRGLMNKRELKKAVRYAR